MDLYIVSQIITFLYYGILGISFLQKDRRKVLILNILVDLLQSIAMYLLNGYTGSAMGLISIFRDTALYIQNEKKSSERMHIILLIMVTALTIGLTVITYNGLFSLLSVFASLVSTFAIWQKNVRRYKFLGIVTGVLWLAYNIYILSVVGILLELVIIIFSTIGYIKDIKKTKA